MSKPTLPPSAFVRSLASAMFKMYCVVACSTIDNCLTCSDTPETAEPPNFGIDDVSCNSCTPPFDPQGGACVVSSD